MKILNSPIFTTHSSLHYYQSKTNQLMRGKISIYQGDIVLAPFTSTIRNKPFSFKLLDKDVTNPLDGDSEIRCDKIMTCEKTLIKKKDFFPKA